MNKAKQKSRIDGETFLRSAFAAEQEVLSVQLKLSYVLIISFLFLRVVATRLETSNCCAKVAIFQKVIVY